MTVRRLDADARTAAMLAAARGLFAEHGYGDVSVAQIARAAGTSPALVFHYFGSKAALHAAVVRAELDSADAHERAALDALPAGTSTRDRVRVALEHELDRLAAAGGAGNPGAEGAAATDRLADQEPTESGAVRLRRADRRAEELRALLRPAGPSAREDVAVTGFLAFVDAAAARWRAEGCPPEGRGPLVEAALGALEGALGDWGP